MPKLDTSKTRIHTDAQKPAAGKASAAITTKRRKRGRPRQDQVAQRDRELLEHALDQFLEKGYEGATVESITSPLRMAKRTVYARYGDKLKLFRAALEHAIDQWLAPLESLPELECDDIEETLYRIGQLLVDTMMCPAGQRLIRITNAESYRMPEIGAYTYERGSRQITDFLEDLFERRIISSEDPEQPDTAVLASTFLNILSGPARLSALGIPADAETTSRLTRQRVRIFLQGALPRLVQPAKPE